MDKRMKLITKTALGIDISHKQISMALLKESTDGIRLLKAAHASVPACAIKNGIIKNPTALATAVRDLRVKNKIGAHHQAALSVIGGPVLIQIIELPADIPTNIGEFVCSEVKHCAILPVGRATSDFCGLKSREKSFGRRLLVAAADTQKLTESATVLERKGLNIVAIEPPSLAYVRACYHKQIAKKFDHNLLLAVVREGVLMLYLFRNETLDFVTTKNFEPANSGDDKYIEWLADEIKAVVRFYDFEVSGKQGKWQVEIVMDECESIPKEKMDMLHLLLTEAVELKIRTFEEASINTPLANPEASAGTSAVAIGLAMKLLKSGEFTPDVNLLPPKLLEAKSEEKWSWVIANIATAIFLLMILSIGLFDAKLKRLSLNTNYKMRTKAIENIGALLQERTLLDGQIKDATQKLNNMSEAVKSSYFPRWNQILIEIASAIPKNARIHSFSSNGSSTARLEGQAISYEAVKLFLDALSRCEHIKSASLAGTEKDSESNKWIKYTINCSLSDQKEYP
jgi:Tfp pilus assembly protein PilN